jgi:DNA-binding CsgD family transcriptional regulator
MEGVMRMAEPIYCTPNEFVVLVGAARGQTTEAIAAARGVSAGTVRTQLNSMFARNEVAGGRGELVARALSDGLVMVRGHRPAAASAVRQAILGARRHVVA